MISTPVNGSAKYEMSGCCRVVPGRPTWYAGLAKYPLGPPPAPKAKPRFSGGTTGVLPSEIRFAIRVSLLPHPVWNSIVLFCRTAMLVPPIDVANGELDGKLTVTKPSTVE